MKAFLYKLLIKYHATRLKTWSKIDSNLGAKKALKLFCTPTSKSKRSTRLPLFNTAEKINFTYDMHQINGYRFGELNHPKVLLVHGWCSDSSFFAHLIPHLLQKNYQVYTFDCIAHGLSSGSFINGVEYQYLLEFILKKYNGFHHVIAHSLGTLASAHAFFTKKEVKQFVFFSSAVSSETQLNIYCKMMKMGVKQKRMFYNYAESKYQKSIKDYTISQCLINNPSVNLQLFHDEADEACPMADVNFMLSQGDFKNLNLIKTKQLGHNKIARQPDVVELVINLF